MSNEDEGPIVSSIFPLPPPFYKSYGPGKDSIHPCAVSVDPPRPPKKNEVYQCYGENFDGKVKTLEESGHKQLFKVNDEGLPIDFKAEMKQLVRNTREKFCKLLDKLHEQASEADCLLITSELESVYVNLLYLVNEYRPHQAREIVLQMARRQLHDKIAMTKRLNAAVDAAEEKLKSLAVEPNGIDAAVREVGGALAVAQQPAVSVDMDTSADIRTEHVKR